MTVAAIDKLKPAPGAKPVRDSRGRRIGWLMPEVTNVRPTQAEERRRAFAKAKRENA